MEKEFVTYTQALALKELGFDEPCFGYYDKSMQVYDLLRFDKIVKKITNKNEWFILAPTYSQAFRWFREKYSLFHNIWNYTHGEPTDLVPNGFTYSIDEDWITIIGKKENGYFEKYYNTYEEAESTCLDKLIEICKNK